MFINNFSVGRVKIGHGFVAHETKIFCLLKMNLWIGLSFLSANSDTIILGVTDILLFEF